MTNTERALLKKLRTKTTVAFRARDLGWIFIDCSEPFDEGRVKKMEDKGIGVWQERGLDSLVFYVLNDWEFCSRDARFVAKKDTVYTVPVGNDIEEPVCLKASHIDLTDFAAALSLGFIDADSLVIGDDIRVFYAADDDYIHTLLGNRDYCNLCALDSIKHVKVTGDTPVINVYKFCSDNHVLQSLDLSETNLKECFDFSYLCSETSSLSSVKMGDIYI